MILGVATRSLFLICCHR